jgi:hypothetical protein
MRLKWIISCLLLNLAVFGQIPDNPDFRFITHLTENNKNREALYLLAQPPSFNPDTLNYLKGMNYYLLKRTDSAALYLGAVSPGSSFYTKAHFFTAVNLLYSKKYKETLAGFSTLNEDTLQKYQQLIALIEAGSYLLLRDYSRFDSVSAGFLYNDYRYANEQASFIELRKEAFRTKKKSPFLAGALSAVVPGLGKFYAGKRGAAAAAFAINAVLAASTLEMYYRSDQNLTSPQVIAFGTLFSFFYAGNIAGSVFSVKQQIKSVNGRINNETLAGIHRSVAGFFR